MYHLSALVTEGNIFYLRYSESTQNSARVVRQGFFDVSRSTFTYLPNTSQVFENQGAKGIIVIDKEITMERSKKNGGQQSETIIEGRVIFTGMAIKDAYMGLLLHLN